MSTYTDELDAAMATAAAWMTLGLSPVNALVLAASQHSEDLAPWPDGAVTGDGVTLPQFPAAQYAPMRNIFRRCYPLPSGNMVHVKPDCRC